MESSRIVIMIQQSKHKWRLETAQGYVLTEDLVISNIFEAERYAMNYISSFQHGWKVIMKPITREVI
jgi:hypothetical protein